MPSYQPDPEGTYPPGLDPNGEPNVPPVSLLYERPAGTWDPTQPGADKNAAIGVPVGSMNLGSSRWNIGFAGSGASNALPYYVGDPIGSPGQDFVMEGAWRGQSYYALVDFPLGHRGIVGIHFKLGTDPNDFQGTQRSHFGWAEVTKFRIGGGNFDFILHGFGYNDTPEAVTIPAPTLDFLTLEVHANGSATPGQVFIKNGSAGDIEFDFYEIHSPSGGGNETLNSAGWNSLADQDYEGSDSGVDLVADGKNDGLDFLEWQRSSQDPTLGAAILDQYGLVPPNTGWEEVGGSSDIVVAEGRVQGTTTLASGDFIDLGLLYDTDQDAFPGNGFFKYLTPGGLIQEGEIVRINTGAIAASAAVPEPNSIMLLAAGAAGLGIWRKRRAG